MSAPAALVLTSPDLPKVRPHAEASVADLAAFAALPEDVQELARRALGAAAWPGDLVAIVKKAYRAGFQDACDEMETPWCSDTAAETAARDILAGH